MRSCHRSAKLGNTMSATPPNWIWLSSLRRRWKRLKPGRSTQDQRLQVLEAKQHTNSGETGYWTISAWCKLNNLSLSMDEAKRMGRMASKLSKEWGVSVGSVPDERFGSVNSYREDVLEEVFDPLGKSAWNIWSWAETAGRSWTWTDARPFVNDVWTVLAGIPPKSEDAILHGARCIPTGMGKGKQDATDREKAIRRYCLECCNDQLNEVRLCPCFDCSLYPYRHFRVDRSVEIKSETGKVHIEAFSAAKI